MNHSSRTRLPCNTDPYYCTDSRQIIQSTVATFNIPTGNGMLTLAVHAWGLKTMIANATFVSLFARHAYSFCHLSASCQRIAMLQTVHLRCLICPVVPWKDSTCWWAESWRSWKRCLWGMSWVNMSLSSFWLLHYCGCSLLYEFVISSG